MRRISSCPPTGTSSNRRICSRTRLPKHICAIRGVWEEDFEIEPWVEGGARLPAAAHAGFEGWTISRYRQTSGRTPEGDPELILEDMDLDGVDVAGDAPEPVAVRALLRRPRAVDGARRVCNDYVIERFTPYFARIAPTAPVPITDIDDAVAEIERVAAGGLPGDPAAGDAAEAVLLARLRPGVGGGAGERRARLLPHPDRRREGERPRRPRRSRS